MPKSSKRIILSNERVNSHGFRVITSGIDLTNFIKNPIMYWMHNTPTDENPTNGMPIGYWTDIVIKDKEISAVPVFDDSDEFAMKIYNKVEHGTIRAASVCLEGPITVDTNKANWVTGQTKPTLLTCVLGEASIVDRGSNADATAVSLDGHSNTFINLNQTLVNNDISSYLNTPPKTMDNDNNKTGDFEKSAHSIKTKAILRNSVEVGKMTTELANGVADVTPADNPKMVDSLIGSIRKLPIKPELIEGKFHRALINLAATKTYDEIDSRHDVGLRSLKVTAPELYKAKFLEKNGRLPADMA